MSRKGKASRLSSLRRSYLKWYKARLQRKGQMLELKAAIGEKSHSLLWVWEFSKKAVLICFLFYIVVQLYAMYVMLRFMDFTYLGELINRTAEILERCVFAYLIKAGLENIGKIWFTKLAEKHSDKENPDDAVG